MQETEIVLFFFIDKNFMNAIFYNECSRKRFKILSHKKCRIRSNLFTKILKLSEIFVQVKFDFSKDGNLNDAVS